MQHIKVENSDSGSNKSTPEKRAIHREKQLLTFVIKATARDQEKNIMISKLQREMSEAIEDVEALKTEVKLKKKIMDAKDDELLVVKTENEALKRQLQLLMQSQKSERKLLKDENASPSLKPGSANLKRSTSDIGSPSTSPRPKLTRKRSIKKPKDSNNVAANIFYNLRKKSKK